MANKQNSSDAIAFAKFMDQLMGGIAGSRPTFGKEGDGYAAKPSVRSIQVEYEDDEDSTRYSGCANCSDCACSDDDEEDDDLFETEAAGFGDSEDEDEEGCAACGETVSSITFTVRGPECFADEISEDVYRLLKGLRKDALKYADQVFEEDAEDSVSVMVSFATSTSTAP